MERQIKIVAGLGNPGSEYKITRHNIGFILADFLREHIASGSPWIKWKQGEYVKASFEGKKIYIVKPMTYMNNSGIMLRNFAAFFKILPAEILVCYDDIALKFGKIRLKRSGSSGGHKGMESVIGHFATSHIPRLKVGIGHSVKRDAKNYVLGKFSEEERDILGGIIEKSANAALETLKNGLEKTMNLYNLNDDNSDNN